MTSSPARAPARPAAASWQLEFAATPLLAGRELYVGEWQCTQSHRQVSREVTRHLELGLQRRGAHLRAIGRDRRVVDATLATFNPAGDELALTSLGPQCVTSLLVRGALADELPRAPGRFAAVSPAAARLHAQLIAARDPVEIEETALGVLHRVARDAQASPVRRAALDPSPARRALAEQLQHVIATRFAERLTVDDIARACGSSAFYSCRVFRAVTGQTLHRHLTRVRLYAAALALPSAGGRLTELALSVGFSSHSHFTRAFRAEFGAPPSALA